MSPCRPSRLTGAGGQLGSPRRVTEPMATGRAAVTATLPLLLLLPPCRRSGRPPPAPPAAARLATGTRRARRLAHTHTHTATPPAPLQRIQSPTGQKPDSRTTARRMISIDRPCRHLSASDSTIDAGTRRAQQHKQKTASAPVR